MSRRAALLRWYRRHARDLPWRRVDDPYAIWVSEVMLQQTQVATVVPYFERFLERFPDVHALAAASEDELLGAWSGLGYYRRARALLAGARAVVDRCGGRLPEDPETLTTLPGIGRYTAGAIASIAFDVEAPVVDGNVRRVLTRWHARSLGELDRGEAERRVWERAARWVRGERPGDWNQALMELGATICTPRAPACDRCPVAAPCEARKSGTPERFPAPVPRRATERVDAAVAVVVRGGRVLLERPPDGSPLRGTWDLPSRERGRQDAATRLREAFLERYGLELRLGDRFGHADHGILHRRIRLEIYGARLRGPVAGREELRWHPLARLDEVPVSGATHKVLSRFERPAAYDQAQAPTSSPAQ